MMQRSGGSRAWWLRGGTDDLETIAHGQAVTCRALKTLADHGWTHHDDVRWPGRRRLVIDHIAVGPAGVLVIDTVRWMGGPMPHHDRLAGAASIIRAAADSLASTLPAALRMHARPIVCLVGDQPVRDRSGSVLVCSTANLGEVVRAFPHVLAPHEVAPVAELLGTYLADRRRLRIRVRAGREPQNRVPTGC